MSKYNGNFQQEDRHPIRLRMIAHKTDRNTFGSPQMIILFIKLGYLFPDIGIVHPDLCEEVKIVKIGTRIIRIVAVIY